MTVPDHIKVLHDTIVKLYAERDEIINRYPPGHGLHKSRTAKEQADKGKSNGLVVDINHFHAVLSHYGYSVQGPNYTLIKE